MADDTIRNVRADELDEVLAVRAQSFGIDAGTGDDVWRRRATDDLEAGRLLGAYEHDGTGGTDGTDGTVGPVAVAKIWDFGQWWGGRQVPMAGISGVVVRPDHRGRGVARTLMTAVVRRTRELGAAVSALYPATIPLYRSVGYEIAGARYRYAFRAEMLRSLGRDPEAKDRAVRRGGVGDAARIRDLMATIHAGERASGPVVWPDFMTEDWLGRPGTFCYLADDGFAVYRWQDSDLIVDQLVAGSTPTARALWAVVGSGSTISTTVYARVAPDDPIHLLAPLEADHETYTERWMFRVVDAPAAITARGYDAGAEVDVVFRLEDDIVAENNGAWRLGVRDAVGRLDPVEDGGAEMPTLTIRGLSALYAGNRCIPLRAAGLLTATDEVCAELDRAFAGRPAWQPDFF